MSTLLVESALAIGASPAAGLLVKATLTMALAMIAVRLARGSRAAVRHVLLAAAFAALVMLPTASVLMPPLPLGLPVAAPPAAGMPAAPDRANVVRAPQPTIAAAAVAPKPIEPSPDAAPRWAAAIWAAGVFLFLLPVLAGVWRIRSLRRAALPWHAGSALARPLAIEAGIRRPVPLLLHESLPGPVTCGLLRPAIMLPPGAQGWSDEELRRAMVHELEHVRRGDWAIHCVVRTVCAVYWFHPLVWIGWRRLALEAERACDDAVLRRSEATAYAEQLVTLAQRLSTMAGRSVPAMASCDDLATRVRAVLDAAQSRGRAGAAWVVAAAVAAVVLVSAIAPLRAVAVVQTAAAAQPAPAFEVASVRPNSSGTPQQFVRREPGGRFTVTNMPLRPLITFAYQLQPFQILGGPDWITTERFDIVAKAAGDPPWAAPWEPDPMRLMLRTLLAERFKLVLRRDTRDMPTYELVLARRDGKPGPRLRPAAADCAAEMSAMQAAARNGQPPPTPAPGAPVRCGMRMMPGRLEFGGNPLLVLANGLAPLVGRIVVDRTGLPGAWDFELAFTPEPGLTPAAGGPPLAPPADTDAPSLFTALQEQLGLKLEASRGPVEVLVIDGVERPAEN